MTTSIDETGASLPQESGKVNSATDIAGLKKSVEGTAPKDVGSSDPLAASAEPAGGLTAKNQPANPASKEQGQTNAQPTPVQSMSQTPQQANVAAAPKPVSSTSNPIAVTPTTPSAQGTTSTNPAATNTGASAVKAPSTNGNTSQAQVVTGPGKGPPAPSPLSSNAKGTSLASIPPRVSPVTVPQSASPAPVNPYTNLNTLQRPANVSSPQTTSKTTIPNSIYATPKLPQTTTSASTATIKAPVASSQQSNLGNTQARAPVTGPIASNQAPRPLTASAAQAQYNLAVRATALTSQNPQSVQPPVNYAPQYIRTQPASNIPRPPVAYSKPEVQTPAANGSADAMKIDSTNKDIIDEAENERTRLENRERKKRWREQNEDRNKDNDLRCRVNKRAHKLYGKERSEAKSLWIEEEFLKRKLKRQEKEGKGPDGNLLIEGTDISSLNHFEMNSVIMSTLSDFASNPAAPPLKDNADLNLLLHKLRTDPKSIQDLFTGQPSAASLASLNNLGQSLLQGSALTVDNMHKMEIEQNGRRMSSGGDEEEEEEDDDKYSHAGSLTASVIDMTAPSANQSAVNHAASSTAAVPAGSADPSSRPANDRTISANSFDGGYTQHHTYGIGNGFDPQVALALSSELFRLISMQPDDRKMHADVHSLATLTAQHSEDTVMQDINQVKQEIEA